MIPKFIHLNTRSDYSITSGLNKPQELIQRAYTLNMPALGMIDYGNFYGVIKFYQAALKYGIKPIIGVKLRIKFNFIPNTDSIINILAINKIGYKNLIILISKAQSQKNSSNTIDNNIIIHQDWLVKYKSGLIILSGGYYGDFGRYIVNKDYDHANLFIDFYNTYFSDFYYFEIHRTNRIYEEQYIKCVIQLSILKNIPIVATNDVCFIHEHGFDTHNIKLAIDQGVTVNCNKNNGYYSPQQFLKTEHEMCMLFHDLPEALQNSVEIAKRCNVVISTGKYFLPVFPTGKINVQDCLFKKSVQGLKDRFRNLYLNQKNRMIIFEKYKKRLFTELDIINKMNFPGYFLIVMEFVQWAKDNNIPVGPGRGSGAGSLVAYVLKITELDPLKFGLIFERFLNPERKSMPDFDIDFCMDKRDLVIDHVAKFYGLDKVAQIITFGTMSARAVIRDVGRALGYPYGFVNNISQLIPLDTGITLKQALSNEFHLIELYQKNIEVKRLIDIAQKLEGVIRNTGKHAGGIVIAPKKLTDFTPLQCDNNFFITQLDKNDIDYVGLLKFDFLGLRTLTIMYDALKLINQFLKRTDKSNICINNIPLNDHRSFQLLQTGNTIAVFQLESYGMRDLIIKLRPDCFEDIISLIALFRPGPLQSGMVDNFINRKHGKEPIFYPDAKWQHISLKPILESTYGIILYQEQVMQIAQVLSGYKLSKAEVLQRAMSKKKVQEMSDQRMDFQENAKKNGISYEFSNKIFDLLEKFSGYGFNKSHSAAYALISYQTLWMKSNYPAEFMTAVMSADLDNVNKIHISIKECIRMNIKIIPPNINLSEYCFKVNSDRNIVYGLGAIKGVGKSVVEEIMRVRQRIKKFNNFFEFCTNIQSKFINKRVLEKLILSGCFDCLNIRRDRLMQSIEQAIIFSNQYNNLKCINQLTLLQPMYQENKILNDQLIKNKKIFWSEKMELDFEKDVLGFYLTGNPLREYAIELNYYINVSNTKNIFITKKNIKKIFGVVSAIRFKITKKNKRIMFLEITNQLHDTEVIFFDHLISLYKNKVKKNDIVIIFGKHVLSNPLKSNKIIADFMMSIDEARNFYIQKLILIINNDTFYTDILHDIKKCILSDVGGKIPIYLRYNMYNNQSNFKLHARWNVSLSEKLLYNLKILLGKNNVYFTF
ncbi:DNA polymerase III subunit alpha [Buchnera aphidicola]|uniref:DNA polymerase III subunit alpha n=1 Tax=Buchnera aphidicola (Sarucallis kahawaluokalani) TaxID=1241878 RepID=A0A4D6Y9W1_9GAMM|nr:DNA polymerase III subunit alpha [Buchnera aphidicola]QCI25962.1 DNA polymerase III subunit alpha [Buchnera aphidicola (Sarucallis kahawaluokalani)]